MDKWQETIGEHKCAACGAPTTPAEPAELEKEYTELYGEEPDPDDIAYVCDDCYQLLLEEIECV